MFCPEIITGTGFIIAYAKGKMVNVISTAFGVISVYAAINIQTSA